MSNRPIRVGDLVMVVRGHVCDLGKTFQVQSIQEWGGWICDECGEETSTPFTGANSGMDYYSAPLPWLKRVPPLSELEGQRTQEDMREPA